MLDKSVSEKLMPGLMGVILQVNVFPGSLFAVKVWGWLRTALCALICLGHLYGILEAFELGSVANALKLCGAYNKLLICLFYCS